MQSKFTPGPWRYGPDFDEMDRDYILKEIDGNLQSIGEVFDRCPVTGLSIPHEQTVANAKLFAAAPDLYAALYAVLTWAAGTEAPLVWLAAARAALAKARGGGGVERRSQRPDHTPPQRVE